MSNIPKQIFYCWFGGEKPQSVLDCIANWKQMLPEYEIIEINDKNKKYFDVEKERETNLWFKTCYDYKMWAYVADYARLKVLYERGGVYFDTDVTVEKDITELLTKNKLVLGWEDKESINIAVGVVVVGHPLIKEMLDFYNDEIWHSKLYTIPQIVTYILRKHYKLNPSTEITENDDILILPPEYFYPVPVGLKIKPEQKGIFVTDNSYTVHWNDGNWSSSDVYNGRDYFSKNKHKIELNKLLKICFDSKKIILDNLFLQITKSCGLYNISINLYWLFRFKYRYDLKGRRWLVLFIFGLKIPIFKTGGQR